MPPSLGEKLMNIFVKVMFAIWLLSLTLIVLVPSFLIFSPSTFAAYQESYELIISKSLAGIASAFLAAFVTVIVVKVAGIVASNWALVSKGGSLKSLLEIKIFPL